MSDIDDVNEILAKHTAEIQRLVELAAASPTLNQDWFDDQVADYFGEASASRANQTGDAAEQEAELLSGEEAASLVNNEGLESQIAILFLAHGEEEAASLAKQAIAGQDPTPGAARTRAI